MIATGLGVLRVWPPLAVVMSGSMAPTINTGDMVVLMRLRSPAKIGDVVAVPVPDDARTRYGYPPVVIHRVFRITDGQIRTKGDARPAADPFTVPQTAVEAKVVADVPAGGRILSFFHSGPGLVWLLFGAALLFGFPLFDRLRDARGREAEATADLRDQLAAVTVSLAQLQAQQERSAQAADKALSQIDGLARLVADALAHQPPAAGDAADAPDTSLPDVAELPGPAVEAARELHTESPTPPGPPAPSEPQVQPEPAAQAAPATEMNAAAQSRPTSPAETGLGRGPTEPLPAVQPALAPDFASVAQASCAARSAVSAAGVPNGLIRLSLPSPAPTCAAVTDASVAARPLGGDARFTSPAGVGRMSAPSRPALERWDALPTGSSVNGDGWAAPPAPVRSPRFQRPGRLIAASLAQPSPGA